MPDDTQTVEYTVRLSGDQWDHAQFRETVSEAGAVIECERPAETARDEWDDAPDVSYFAVYGTGPDTLAALIDDHGVRQATLALHDALDHAHGPTEVSPVRSVALVTDDRAATLAAADPATGGAADG